MYAILIACKHLRRAAEAGDPEAMYKLGNAYKDGTGACITVSIFSRVSYTSGVRPQTLISGVHLYVQV